MSLSANVGRSVKRVIPSMTNHPIRTSKAFISDDQFYGAILPDVEAANIAPYSLVNTKTYEYKKRQSTSVGVRATTDSFQKFENEPLYLLHREMSGFNEWSRMKAINNPEVGVIDNPYTKLYVRDPSTGQAVMPQSFEGKLEYDELQKVLQKADHYFFQDRPGPPIQLYVPLRDPRITQPQSKLAKVAEAIDQANNNTRLYDNGETFNNDDEMFKYLDKQFERIYEIGDKPDLINRNQNSRDAGSISTFSLTAQQRRAEFWRKYLDLFNYYDLLHTCQVRVTRATGRVSTPIALVVMGNCHGIFTYGRGKASTFDLAMRRALMRTRRNVLFTPLHENRTAYYAFRGVYKRSQLLLHPHRRGVGIRAGPLTFNLLRAVGYQDATLKLIGSRNMWNVVRAWMACLKVQESYREIAFARGAHYQHMLDPFRKNPPAPGRDDIRDLEDAAATAFEDAVKTVFKNRQLLQTDTFKELRPHFTLRDNFEKKWEKHLKDANVPEAFHMYPAFSEYLDAAASLKAIEKVDEASKAMAVIHRDLDPSHIASMDELNTSFYESLNQVRDASADRTDNEDAPSEDDSQCDDTSDEDKAFNSDSDSGVHYSANYGREDLSTNHREVYTHPQHVGVPNYQYIHEDHVDHRFASRTDPEIMDVVRDMTMTAQKHNFESFSEGVIINDDKSRHIVGTKFNQFNVAEYMKLGSPEKSPEEVSYYTPAKGETVDAIYDKNFWESGAVPSIKNTAAKKASAPRTNKLDAKEVTSDVEK